MKKLIVIPIMFLYLLAVSGVLIHMHYCGQQLESWGMYVKNDGCKDDVCTDEPAEEEGCCKDKTIVAKVSTEQNVVHFFKLQVSASEWVLPSQPEYPVAYNISFSANEQHMKGMPNAPPGRWQNIPLFKLHSSFTYYG